ncbi:MULTISPECIES: DnaJ domain-containing protein [Calothrix]|uniref:DnaJ domain-containing protein n=2 Tax=Calothrix TaxID=1186 RepID=A0ABR8AJG7_9CYAN|nr:MULTISPECIES: DnaJ domain-containing protein [Calothrix]MBD2200162.1 DnaJ domain-containing protein [Calothrix parietina FACHB-288]MBD2229128.1 DnaJ domain-containing protein [Calothrix anomala FACHB-343]
MKTKTKETTMKTTKTNKTANNKTMKTKTMKTKTAKTEMKMKELKEYVLQYSSKDNVRAQFGDLRKKSTWQAAMSHIKSMSTTSSHVVDEVLSIVLYTGEKKVENKKVEVKKTDKKEDISKIKREIYKLFKVKSTKQLRENKRFKMAVDGLDINLRDNESWKVIYRRYIGIVPGEENAEGYGVINGVDIFKYSYMWQVLGLDGNTAKVEDIKREYRKLCKIYHPDVPGTGDARIFDRLTIFYESLIAVGEF